MKNIATVWMILGAVLVLPSLGQAQENMRIERERERLVRQQERERFNALELSVLERDAIAVLSFAADGTLAVLDRRNPSPDPVEVAALRLGKSKLTLAEAGRQEGGWRLREAPAAGVAATEKLQFELKPVAGGKAQKLTCVLEQARPTQGTANKIYVLRGDAVDFHCIDRAGAG